MKKMMLVPPEALWGRADPIAHQVSKLDVEMQGILQRQDLDEYTKSKMYHQVLQRYLQAKDQLQVATPVMVKSEAPPSQPPPPPTTKAATTPSTTPTSSPPLQPTTTKVEQEVLDSVPISYRSKAKRLLNYIQQVPNISFNARSELVIDGQPVPGSHATDLVNDVLRDRKNQPLPRAANQFIQALAKVNPPQNLIGNTKHWHAMQSPWTTPTLPLPLVKNKKKMQKEQVQRWLTYKS